MVGGLVGLAKNNIYLSGGISNLTPYCKKNSRFSKYDPIVLKCLADIIASSVPSTVEFNSPSSEGKLS